MGSINQFCIPLAKVASNILCANDSSLFHRSPKGSETNDYFFICYRRVISNIIKVEGHIFNRFEIILKRQIVQRKFGGLICARKIVSRPPVLCYKPAMATDFFDREARAQKQTRLLLWLFGAAVLVVVALVYVVLASVIWAFQHPLFDRAWWNPMTLLLSWMFLLGEALVHPFHFLARLWNPWHFGWITLGTLLSIAAGCFYKIRLLSAGGPAVAELLGGRRIETDTTDTDEKRLRNVVEALFLRAIFLSKAKHSSRVANHT